MHTTMVPERVKIMKIQAGVQVSRQGELRRHLQLWKCFGKLYFIVIVLDRNIVSNFVCPNIRGRLLALKYVYLHRVGKGFSGRVTPLFPTMVVQNQQELGEGSAIPTDPHHTPTITQPSTSQPQKTQKPRKPKRKDTQVPQPSGPTDIVADEVVHKELGDSLVRAATTASSLEAEQDSGNITKTRSKATPNESSSLGTTSGGGPRCQETMGDTIAQTSLKLKELMELCANLQQKVLDLEKTKTTQQNESTSLKRRVKKLEQKKRSRTHGLKRLHKVSMFRKVDSSGDEEDLGEDASKQGRRINAIDADEDIALVNVQDDADNEIFDVDALTSDEVFAEQEVAAKDVNLIVDEVTLAQALATLKSVKPKVKWDVIKEPNVPVNAASAPTKVSADTTTTTIILTPRKGIVITELDTPTTTISSQQSHDKGKGIMIEEPVKTMKKKVQIMLDEEVASKLQDEFNEEERLAREKAEKEKEANIALTEKMFDRAFKRVNTFVDFKTDLVEDEEEVAIDVVPLAIKSPSIVGWKIHKEGKKSYYQIIRADGKS
ncbi:hypothetical protein Tco_1204695 [Tanacetum coccineum]